VDRWRFAKKSVRAFAPRSESGRNTIDIRLDGAADLDEAKAGRFYPLRDLLSLPNVLNADNWSDKHMIWSGQYPKIHADSFAICQHSAGHQ